MLTCSSVTDIPVLSFPLLQLVMRRPGDCFLNLKVITAIMRLVRETKNKLSSFSSLSLYANFFYFIPCHSWLCTGPENRKFPLCILLWKEHLTPIPHSPFSLRHIWDERERMSTFLFFLLPTSFFNMDRRSSIKASSFPDENCPERNCGLTWSDSG